MALTLEERVAERADRRANPPEAAAIRQWYESDCGHSGGCQACEGRGGCEECGRCGRCSLCRPEQRTPGGTWDYWLFLGGRGTGKTRAAAEDVGRFCVYTPQARQAIVAPTFADARDTCVEGESGLLELFARYGWVEDREYVWNRSIGEIKLINGGRFKLYSAEKPERLRGPQHHRAWCDELAQIARHAVDAWHMLRFGLRLGKHPQIVATTTPLPLSLIMELNKDPHAVVTRGATRDNNANLPAVTMRSLYEQYDGTRLGRQELDGDILDDLPGALWKRTEIDQNRVGELPDWIRSASGLQVPFALLRTVVAVDPATTNTIRKGKKDKKGETGEGVSDETGIIVAGLGNDGVIYILADHSLRESPAVWARRILEVYDLHNANEIVIETNNGGEALADLIRAQEEIQQRTTRPAPIEMIHAKDGKRVRAEMPSLRYQQGRVKHLGTHKLLEDQLCTWMQSDNESPDRLDACVYSVLRLSDSGGGSTVYSSRAHIPRYSVGQQGGANQYALHSANHRR